MDNMELELERVERLALTHSASAESPLVGSASAERSVVHIYTHHCDGSVRYFLQPSKNQISTYMYICVSCVGRLALNFIHTPVVHDEYLLLTMIRQQLRFATL